MFNSIKESFFRINWYNFFDNSTVAAVFAIVIGVLIAVWQYKKQKKIDFIEKQKLEIIDLLILLKTKLEHVNFILQRILNTYKWIANDAEYLKRFLTALEKHEIPRLSILINEEIPLIDKKLAIYLNSFFKDEMCLKRLHKNYKDKLKKWHDFIATDYKKWIDSIANNKEIPSDLNIEEINAIIDKLIEEVRKI